MCVCGGGGLIEGERIKHKEQNRVKRVWIGEKCVYISFHLDF